MQKGLLATFERQHYGLSYLNSDMRLRVYSIVPYNAPIAQACRNGDFATACALFQSGQASVYDSQVLNGRYESLSDLVWDRMIEAIQHLVYDYDLLQSRRGTQCLDGPCSIFCFMVDNGLDPGEPTEFGFKGVTASATLGVSIFNTR
jgi:hypothetical protein